MNLDHLLQNYQLSKRTLQWTDEAMKLISGVSSVARGVNVGKGRGSKILIMATPTTYSGWIFNPSSYMNWGRSWGSHHQVHIMAHRELLGSWVKAIDQKVYKKLIKELDPKHNFNEKPWFEKFIKKGRKRWG